MSAANNANATAGRDTLSIDFPNEEIRSVLRNVADLYQLNIIIPETLQGRTTVKLANVTWRQVFTTVLDPVGYTFVEDGNIIRIVAGRPAGQTPANPAGQQPPARPGPIPSEPQTFLGVETLGAPHTVAEHIGKPDVTGVVVISVLSGSPADGVIQPNDILLALDDQKLADQAQFSGLVRSRKSGDGITLTYFRSGREGRVAVKLGQRKPSDLPALGAIYSTNPEFEEIPPGERTAAEAELAQHGMVALRDSATFLPGDFQIARESGAGIVELKKASGSVSVVVRDRTGAVTLSGPYNTAAEQKAAPVAVQAQVEYLLELAKRGPF
jgi:hypothetical protein